MSKILTLLTVVLMGSTSTFAAAPLHQQIDKAIAARAGGAIAVSASDAEFLRRVSLDLTGIIPTAAEARQFLNDKDPNKRTKLIDRLLSGKDYPRRMREMVTVWLLERRTGTVVPDQQWNQYLESAFTANKPWDALVREMIAADGTDEKTKAAIRFLIDGGRASHHLMTQDVARLMLGMNLQCAQCHNDPNVRGFKQSHYFGLYSFLQHSKLKRDKEKRQILVETVAKEKTEFKSVFARDPRFVGLQLPDRKEITLPNETPRQILAKELTASDNERFVRNAVNRFWFTMMGRGLVHPLDLLHDNNPASHPELFKALADDFVAHKFDVKHLLREIALSEAYQRSSVVPEGVKVESIKPESYRVAVSRGLSPEQLAWSLMRATGNLQRIASTPVPKDSKFTYKDYINNRIPVPDNLPDVMTLFVASFGQPAGNPEVEFSPSMSQALFLMNEKLMMNWLKPAKGNLMERLLKQSDSTKLAEELYLTCLTRMPDAEEKKLVADWLKENDKRRESALSELAWALLTSTEFRLNH